MDIDKQTEAYIIKTLLKKCKTYNQFKSYYIHVTGLMGEKKIYSFFTNSKAS